MTTAGLINTTARPVATRVIDGDTYHVDLDLDAAADTLLDQIAATLYREHRIAQLLLLGNPKTRPAEKASIRTQLKASLTLARAFDIPLYPAQAEGLGVDLMEATEEPPQCDSDCPNYATRPDGLCNTDGETADNAAAGYAHLRAV